MVDFQRRAWTRIGASAGASFVAGCALFQSPYADNPSYRQGERGSVSFAAVSNMGTYDCKDQNNVPIPGCTFTGKVILTKPTDNVSFQVYIQEPNPAFVQDKAAKPTRDRLVMCASPAEAAKTLSTSSALALALNLKVAGAPASQSASASNSVTEAVLALSAQDAPSHYVAVASYANCLAFASGMLDAATAARMQEAIFNNAKDIALTAVKPSAKSDESGSADGSATVKNAAAAASAVKGAPAPAPSAASGPKGGASGPKRGK